jgi:hypothetical protein
MNHPVLHTGFCIEIPIQTTTKYYWSSTVFTHSSYKVSFTTYKSKVPHCIWEWNICKISRSWGYWLGHTSLYWAILSFTAQYLKAQWKHIPQILSLGIRLGWVASFQTQNFSKEMSSCHSFLITCNDFNIIIQVSLEYYTTTTCHNWEKVWKVHLSMVL